MHRHTVVPSAFSRAALLSVSTRVALLSALLLATWLLPVRGAAAQMFSYNPDRPRSVQALSLTYTVVDFRFDGAGTPTPSFAFDGPLYGVTYTRPNFHVKLGYGRDERLDASIPCEDVSNCGQRRIDLRMLDASITTWGEIRVTGTPGMSRLFVPIALHTGYRRVAPDGLEDSLVDAFNITVLGIGTGVGAAVELGAGLRLEARATPIVGLALRAFGESAGSSWLFDGHVQLQAPRLIGRFGLAAGYGFRAQVWNVSASQLFPTTHDDVFDYSGASHAASVGITW